MTANKTIHVLASGACEQFRRAKAGYVSYLLITGVDYPPELRQSPPRIKLLEDNIIGKYMPRELLDEWPDAPGSWPPLPDAEHRTPAQSRQHMAAQATAAPKSPARKPRAKAKAS